LGARLGAPDAQAPVRRGQNRNTLVDMRASPPLWRQRSSSRGDQEPRHCVPLGPTEHHVDEESQHVRLQVPVARLLVGVVPCE
jgi:hypothetical protein